MMSRLKSKKYLKLKEYLKKKKLYTSVKGTKGGLLTAFH